MNTLSTHDMLRIWEYGLNQSQVQRALVLLSAACPEMQPDVLAKLSIGQRDRHLLLLRERLFGSKLASTVVCPECSERIEWENKVHDFLVSAEAVDATATDFSVSIGDYQLRFRLPDSLDIATVIDSQDEENAQQLLLARCLLSIEHLGESCTVEQLPDFVIQELSRSIESADPLADIRINLRCPECAHQWDVQFDITSFLWIEINDWAERMLQTIHQLALSYGWSEREIIDLNPVRRQLYLGMLRS